MSTQVIIFVADDAYLNHAKAFMVNCRRQGNWRGDFCLISPAGSKSEDLPRRGVDVFVVAESAWNFMVKLWAFTEYFHQWDRALCIDLDVLVQGDLNEMCDRLAAKLPKMLCDLEDGSTIDGLKQWDADWSSHPEIYEELERRFPHANERMYNASFIFYQPASLPLDTRDRLLAVHEEFKEANPTKADQMLLNLVLYDHLELAGKDNVCFCGLDHPTNRVYSEGRGWRGDEAPIVLHYTRWMAPWIVKQPPTAAGAQALIDLGLPPETGGYFNHRLGRICHELYAENLAAFDEEFPLA